MTRDELLVSLRAVIADERVLRAVAEVDRAAFVPPRLRDRAWEDEALPIGQGQTISQPRVVARMCELLGLRGDERVLDVGTGSGYHAALLARLARHVWSIEVHRGLSERAGRALQMVGIGNVTLLVGDGSRGLPDEAPFDAVNVAATGTENALSALEGQLAPGGRLVAPVRNGTERLVRVTLEDGAFVRSEHEAVRFVPLVGGVGTPFRRGDR
jgi:protein-L-isoaspartate(D-aspartate) O-methyltransferase